MMRLLVDSCVCRPAVDDLRAAGHDVVAAHDWPEDPGDAEVLKVSNEENRVLVTLDKDFGELVFVTGAPHRGILRLVNTRAQGQGRAILRILEKYGEELSQGALIVADPRRVRVRLGESSN